MKAMPREVARFIQSRSNKRNYNVEVERDGLVQRCNIVKKQQKETTTLTAFGNVALNNTASCITEATKRNYNDLWVESYCKKNLKRMNIFMKQQKETTTLRRTYINA